MPLFTERTQLDRDLAFKDSLILLALKATNHLAITLDQVYREFYSLPPDRLAAVLNHDVAASLAMCQNNTALGVPANEALDLVGYGTVRAPVELPPHVSFNGTEFVVTEPQPSEQNPD
jgi:hypothetical protein